MIVILVLGTFLMSIVVERLKKAPKYDVKIANDLQTDHSAEVEVRRARPVVGIYEVKRHINLYPVRSGTDRRQA